MMHCLKNNATENIMENFAFARKN